MRLLLNDLDQKPMIHGSSASSSPVMPGIVMSDKTASICLSLESACSASAAE